MSFYDSFITICEQKGVAPSRVLDDVGMGRSAVISWRKGSKPTNATIKIIADYFDISIEELKTGKIDPDAQKEPLKNKKKLVKPKDDKLTDDEIEIIKNFRLMTEEEKHAFEVFLRNSKR